MRIASGEREVVLLPLHLTPTEFVAPGVTRADYRLLTSSGPLAITLVVVDPHDPTVRLGAVLAGDRIVSNAETVSAMANRTGAVAGVNADYFDINGTNQPLGMVVRDGTLLRTPSRRAVLTITRSGDAGFAPYRFSATATDNGTPLTITGVDIWPPEGGASFLTPAYGMLAPANGVLLAQLAPEAVDATAAFGGRFRVTSVGPAPHALLATPALALGPAAQRTGTLPQPGDEVEIRGDTDPPLGDVATAVGGGPLLVANRVPYDDPAPPAPEETNVRFPVSGAAKCADGTLLLLAVDGRRPDRSIGLTRPEFGALMRGLGATVGMAFDSGGSATLVARVLGDRNATVRNDPSDGIERPVADGLFVYSDAPEGAPSRLVLRPETIRALPGVTLALETAVTDAAGHPRNVVLERWRGAAAPPSLATLGADGMLHTGAHPGNGTLTVARGTLRTTVALSVVDRVQRITIDPLRPAIAPGAEIALHAQGFDAMGRSVALGENVHWSAIGGAIASDGTFRAASADARVTAAAGGAHVQAIVRVGQHDVALGAFGDATRWVFATAPAHGPGGVSADPGCGCLMLAYDFREDERAAYLRRTLALPPATRTLIVEVNGDGNGAGIRAQLVDWEGTRKPVTLARSVDWTGWRTLAVPIPANLAPPVALESFYAVATLGTGRIRANGVLSFRNLRAVVAGTDLR